MSYEDQSPNEQYATIEARSELLLRSLGESALNRLLEEHNLETIMPEEAAAIAGCIFRLRPIGYVPGRHDSPDEILRTRIALAEQREDATQRDLLLWDFKKHLHELSRDGQIPPLA